MKSMKRNLTYFTYVKQYFSIVCVVLLRYQSICKLGQVKIPRGKSDFNVTCPSGNRRKSLSSSTVEMASLISPSTAEVERSFSLMNLISTPPRKRLSAENLGHCMRICKFAGSLTENDYQQILSLLEDAGTKSKSRRIDHRL